MQAEPLKAGGDCGGTEAEDEPSGDKLKAEEDHPQAADIQLRLRALLWRFAEVVRQADLPEGKFANFCAESEGQRS